MPRRTDIESILIIGSGPIVIGQACEFDYSGVQACRALREEGYRVILANSNPATIMTDPDFADATYVEPLDGSRCSRQDHRPKERPDAVLPTLGGQTGLNLAMDLQKRRRPRERHDVELIGADAEAIAHRGGPRAVQGRHARASGSTWPARGMAHTMDEAERTRGRAEIGLPVIIRPVLHPRRPGQRARLHTRRRVRPGSPPLRAGRLAGLARSSSRSRSWGWKEYELEVMRDHADNCVIVCSHREPRPDGRAHRRLDHRRPGPDADRRRVPADARRRTLRHASAASGWRPAAPTCSSRSIPDTGTPGHHRDEPAGVAVVRAGVVRPPASRSPRSPPSSPSGTPSTRSPTTSPRRRPRQLRAVHRLRRHQVPAVGVREVPRHVRRCWVRRQMQSVGEVMAIGRTFAESPPEGHAGRWSSGRVRL